jgi:hypothetical protein
MMPLAVFAGRSFIGLNLLTFFLYGSLGGLVVLLPYFLIRMEHWTAVQAGAALLPLPVLIGIGSRYMGRVAARYGGRGPLTLGSILVGIGLVLYARVGSGAIDYWTDLLPGTSAGGLGHGSLRGASDHQRHQCGRSGTCRHRLRLQQRRGAYRRTDRHGLPGVRIRPPGFHRKFRRWISHRRAGWRGVGTGGGRMRTRAHRARVITTRRSDRRRCASWGRPPCS